MMNFHFQGLSAYHLSQKYRFFFFRRPLPMVGVFDIPNPNRYDILSISIFCQVLLFISISIFSRMAISRTTFFKLSLSILIFSKFSYRYFVGIDSLKKSVDISSIFQKMSMYEQSISIFHHKSMNKLHFLLNKMN